MSVREWTDTRRDELAIAGMFFDAMISELAANAHKGDRPGWLTMNDREIVGEVMYHAAKLTYALRQHRQGDGPIDKVLEFAADVANMAMMAADIAGCFPLSSDPHQPPPSVQAVRPADGPRLWKGDQA